MTATLGQRRIGPEQISAVERGRLDLLASMMNQASSPALRSATGEELELPVAIYKVLRQIVNGMREGRTMVLVPENEVMTTQAAANYLGVSRPHLVTLLESGRIPFHTVGTHRRVHFGDIDAFAKERDQERRSILDGLTGMISEAGLYDTPVDES